MPKINVSELTPEEKIAVAKDIMKISDSFFEGDISPLELEVHDDKIQHSARTGKINPMKGLDDFVSYEIQQSSSELRRAYGAGKATGVARSTTYLVTMVDLELIRDKILSLNSEKELISAQSVIAPEAEKKK